MKKAGAPHMGAPAFGLGGERLALALDRGLGDRGLGTRRGHPPTVGAVLATTSAAADQATLLSRSTGLIGVPLVGDTHLVGLPTTLAGDFTQRCLVHRGKALTLLAFATRCSLSHQSSFGPT